MKYTIRLMIFTLCIVASSCQRSGNEVVEDSKTAARHMGRGMRSLFGKQGDSRQVSSMKQYAYKEDNDFIPLDDQDLYRQLSLGDPEALENISQDSAIAQSAESPGEAGSSIPSIQGFQSPLDLGLAHIFQNLHFDTNDHTVRGGENLRIVDQIADYLTKNPKVYLFVEGHCDERGAAAYNLALGTRRSNSVRNLLIKQGVNLDRVFTISYGKERPLALGRTPAEWRQNRRAQFKLFEKTAVR